MSQLPHLSIHVNRQQTFFLNEKIVSTYSGKLKKIIKQEKKQSQIKKNLVIEIDDFPGGPDGFELLSRFCYNNGSIEITVSNASLLYCCAIFLRMTENLSNCNLLKQTERFLEGMFYWSWNDILTSLKSCQPFLTYADSSGLVQKLICGLLAKIAQDSDANPLASSSSSSSPGTAKTSVSSSAKTTPESTKPSSSSSGKQWWFDDLTLLPPAIIKMFIRNLGAYGSDNNSLILTRFILHYLKSNKHAVYSRSDYGGLADTAVHGVILVGRNAFSCRGLLLVLRIVCGFGPSKDCRVKLERLIGSMLEQASLDDLLISGHDKKGVYDVKLVLRLIKIFANSELVCIQKMKKVGRLIDKYLGEISPDQNLKMSKFLQVAESLPDSARDCFDGVYKAIDMYLESHPTLSFEDRSRICRCLNYEKLSLGTCKELAKNPIIPPNIAIEALKCQKYHTPKSNNDNNNDEDMRINIERMQRRVVELEKACKEMKDQMSWLVHHNLMPNPTYSKTLCRLC